MKDRTVMVVDDEEMILKSLHRNLMDEAYAVITVSSAEQALELMEDRHIDLLISDHNMPGMKGLDFLKQVKRKYPLTLTIMLTAYADIKIATQAINEAGIYKFIVKPWDEVDLRLTIRRALESLEVVQQRDVLLQKIKQHQSLLDELEKEYPGITRVDRDAEGYVIID